MKFESFDIEHLRNEVADNSRLRFGLWVVTVLLFSWLWLIWADLNVEKTLTLKQLNRKLVSLQHMDSVEVWERRSMQLNELLAKEEEGFWQAGTKGQAKAKLQTAIGGLISHDDFISPQVKVGEPSFVENLRVCAHRAAPHP